LFKAFFGFEEGNIKSIHQTFFALCRNGMSAEFLMDLPVHSFKEYIKNFVEVNKETLDGDIKN